MYSFAIYKIIKFLCNDNIMGVKNLMKFIKKFAPSAIEYKTIKVYRNTIMGIDANLLIYKLVYAIRARGYDLNNRNLIVTHIHSLLLKFYGFKKYNITPIFVFDSSFPSIKYKTIEEREKIRQKLINKYKGSKTKKGKRIYYYIKSDITSQEINQCRELMKIFGYMVIDAKEEADAQLVELYKSSLIQYIVSDDMDILPFGGGRLLKKFSIAEKKLIQEINLNTILKEAKISMDQFIEISVLLGTDYCDNKPMAPNKAYNLIKNKEHNVAIECGAAIKYFKNPPVKKIVKIENKKHIMKDQLTTFLKKFNYRDAYIDKILTRFIDY